MKGFFQGAAIFLGVLVVILGLTWIFQGNDFFMYKVFAPKVEQVRYDTFKQSQAYNDGMLQELRKAQIEYIKTDSAHKQALGSVMVHEFASYDEDKLPQDLRDFLHQLRADQETPLAKFNK